MKKIITLFVLVLISVTAFAQVPEKMSYQAVIRDASDALVASTGVGMQVSILEGSATGTPVYVETHTPTTNVNGLVSIEVGDGTVVSGDFTTIDWGGDSFWIKIETDPTGGTSYTITGTSQLLSVPYALYAKNADVDGNTLDQAYNEEMTGSPTTRTILADDGKIEIVATDNVALELSPDGLNDGLVINSIGSADGISIDNDGSGEGIEMDNDSTGDAINIDNTDSAGDGLNINNDTGGDAIDLTNDGGGDALTIDNAGAGDAVFVDNIDGAGFAISVTNTSPMGGVDILDDGTGTAVLVDNTGGGDGVLITNDSAGNGLDIDNDGGGNAIDVSNTGGGDGLTIDQEGAGDAVFVDNIDGTGFAISVTNSSPMGSVDVLDDGTGTAVLIDNTGGGDGMLITNDGAGNALDIDNDGTGDGIDITNDGTGKALDITNMAGADNSIMVAHGADSDAVMIDNAGAGKGVVIFNGDPAGVGEALVVSQVGTATGILADNAGPGIGIHALNLFPGNVAPVIRGEHMGLGSVAHLSTDDNDANLDPTLFATNMGAGSAGDFATLDNPAGKVNAAPTVNVVNDGLGVGLNVRIINDLIGPDANTEPALFAAHDGFGQTAHFETSDVDNTEHTVEIINSGLGHGLHIDVFGNPGTTPDDAMYVEMANTSGFATGGRIAVFDMHSVSTLADSGVLIRSAATASGHSALRVIAASTSSLAGVFEGDVEVSSDITIGADASIGGTMSATTKLFKIDHPLDPENKYLIHNSIESNERVNIYSGNITTDEDGFATVEFPEYMSALNTDFKYQLTIVDKSFAQAIIWEPMNTENNTFVIKTDMPNIKVSWQMTGTRQDKWALENPLEVEVDKNNGF